MLQQESKELQSKPPPFDDVDRRLLDHWSTREKLLLAFCKQSGTDANWQQISEQMIKLTCDDERRMSECVNRPDNFFAPDLCALQYDELIRTFASTIECTNERLKIVCDQLQNLRKQESLSSIQRFVEAFQRHAKIKSDCYDSGAMSGWIRADIRRKQAEERLRQDEFDRLTDLLARRNAKNDSENEKPKTDNEDERKEVEEEEKQEEKVEKDFDDLIEISAKTTVEKILIENAETAAADKEMSISKIENFANSDNIPAILGDESGKIESNCEESSRLTPSESDDKLAESENVTEATQQIESSMTTIISSDDKIEDLSSLPAKVSPVSISSSSPSFYSFELTDSESDSINSFNDKSSNHDDKSEMIRDDEELSKIEQAIERESDTITPMIPPAIDLPDGDNRVESKQVENEEEKVEEEKMEKAEEEEIEEKRDVEEEAGNETETDDEEEVAEKEEKNLQKENEKIVASPPPILDIKILQAKIESKILTTLNETETTNCTTTTITTSDIMVEPNIDQINGEKISKQSPPSSSSFDRNENNQNHGEREENLNDPENRQIENQNSVIDKAEIEHRVTVIDDDHNDHQDDEHVEEATDEKKTDELKDPLSIDQIDGEKIIKLLPSSSASSSFDAEINREIENRVTGINEAEIENRDTGIDKVEIENRDTGIEKVEIENRDTGIDKVEIENRKVEIENRDAGIEKVEIENRDTGIDKAEIGEFDGVHHDHREDFDEDDGQDSDFRNCALQIHNQLAIHRFAYMFRKPPNVDRYPAYRVAIFRPTDLATIRKQIIADRRHLPADTEPICSMREYKRELYRMYCNAMLFHDDQDRIATRNIAEMWHETERLFRESGEMWRKTTGEKLPKSYSGRIRCEDLIDRQNITTTNTTTSTTTTSTTTFLSPGTSAYASSSSSSFALASPLHVSVSSSVSADYVSASSSMIIDDEDDDDEDQAKSISSSEMTINEDGSNRFGDNDRKAKDSSTAAVVVEPKNESNEIVVKAENRSAKKRGRPMKNRSKRRRQTTDNSVTSIISFGEHSPPPPKKPMMIKQQNEKEDEKESKKSRDAERISSKNAVPNVSGYFQRNAETKIASPETNKKKKMMKKPENPVEEKKSGLRVSGLFRRSSRNSVSNFATSVIEKSAKQEAKPISDADDPNRRRVSGKQMDSSPKSKKITKSKKILPKANANANNNNNNNNRNNDTKTRQSSRVPQPQAQQSQQQSESLLLGKKKKIKSNPKLTQIVAKSKAAQKRQQ